MTHTPIALFTAAPKMYAALLEAEEVLSDIVSEMVVAFDSDDKYTDNATELALHNVQVAIAKAEGKESTP